MCAYRLNRTDQLLTDPAVNRGCLLHKRIRDMQPKALLLTVRQLHDLEAFGQWWIPAAKDGPAAVRTLAREWGLPLVALRKPNAGDFAMRDADLLFTAQ